MPPKLTPTFPVIRGAAALEGEGEADVPLAVVPLLVVEAGTAPVAVACAVDAVASEVGSPEPELKTVPAQTFPGKVVGKFSSAL